MTGSVLPKAIRWNGVGRRLAAVLVLAAAVVAVSPAGPAEATTPKPEPGQVPGLSTTAFEGLSLFYQAQTHQLVHRFGTTSGFGALENLGGVLTSGPAAITIGSEFAGTHAFVRGGDNGVWYRLFSDGSGEWGPWQTVQGGALGAPTTSCVGDSTAQPIVWVRGGDNALWRRSLAGGSWRRLGGVLAADPGAVPAVGGSCPAREDVFVIGTDRTVWEFVNGTFRRIGGRSAGAPAAVDLPSGETDVFVRGTDNALWMNRRVSFTSGWSGWQRVGGILSSPPVANRFPSQPVTRIVLALGADGDVWRGNNVVGTSTWTWSELP
jgi:hypothetical protein